FFFSSRRRHTRCLSDWSSDVCSSDLELRTPLTHLRAQVQWAAAEGRSEAETRDALGAMERVLDQAAKLVEELLLIARGENRQLEIGRASCREGVEREVVGGCVKW